MPNTKLLLEGIKNNKIEDVRKAIEQEGTDVNADLTQGKLGVLSNYTPTVLKAVWQDSQDNLGYRPLHWAAREGRLEIFNYLCSKGADINSLNYIGNTPLHVALYFQQSEIVKSLVQRKARLDIVNRGSTLLNIKEQFTVLHYAVMYGKSEDVILLLENGAPVDSKGACGLSPLHLATRQPDTEKLRLLIKHSNFVNIKDEEGKTPLHHAILEDLISFDAVTLLIENKAEVNSEDHKKMTPLDLLLENITDVPSDTQLYVIELLLHAGADYDRFYERLKSQYIMEILYHFNIYLLEKTKTFANSNEPNSSFSEKIGPSASLPNPSQVDQVIEVKSAVSLAPPPPPPPPPKSLKPKGNIEHKTNTHRIQPQKVMRPKSNEENIIEFLKKHPKFEALRNANASKEASLLKSDQVQFSEHSFSNKP